MADLWFEISENPAYRHILLNHLPVTGLVVSACVLAWAIWENRWQSLVFGLSLCLLTSASAILVMQSGDAAYPFLFDRLDGAGQAWLDEHAELADRFGRTLPANALVAALALAIGAWRRSWRRGLGVAVLCTSAISLVAAGMIATAGGQVRHPEFRLSNRPDSTSSSTDAPLSMPVQPSPDRTLAMRRLTEAQYRNAIADIFGEGIEIAGRFEPESRRDGLIALGTSRVTISASGFEQYEIMANEIARQALEPGRREKWLPCSPEVPTRPDRPCFESVLRAIGREVFRRPLTDREVEQRLEIGALASSAFGDFDVGLKAIITSLLVAPDFLFRIETVADPTSEGMTGLSNATLASRLSYFLWNSGPDAELLEIARRGDLADTGVYSRQVDRLLSSPRLEEGVRALFEDIFQFDEFERLAKDPIRYPIYSARVASDAKEQTLRTLTDHLLDRDGDYRALFTTERSFMTRVLGPVYALPVRAESGWEEVMFPATSGRRGLLTHASFNMLHAHAGRSSPTLRGLFLREALLCQHVPPAPADVDFGLFNADESPDHRTARDRLAVHSSSATCRSCHLLTDPIGLGLEPFDGMGRFRTTENGATIDPSGDLDGRDFRDPAGLGEAFAASDRLTACLAKQAYQYAIGRVVVPEERRWLRALDRRFAELGYRVPDLMREIAHAPGFRTTIVSSVSEELARESRFTEPFREEDAS